MNSPFHTEAPEKVREVPAVAPAKAHHGEGPRGILLMALYLLLLAALVLGCYQVFQDPMSHYPYATIDREEPQAPADSGTAQTPEESTTAQTPEILLQPVTALAANTGATGSDVAGADTVVATFQDMQLSNQQFIYYYWDCFYNLYDAYGTSLYSMLSVNVPFDQQMATEEQTWHQYLSSMAVYTWQQTAILCAEARANGFALSDEELTALEDSLAKLDTYAANNGLADGNAYLQNMFDPSSDVDSFRAYNLDMLLASAYAANLYDTIYAENYDPDAKVTYCVDVRHILITAEDAANAESMAAAKSRAEELYAQWQQDPTEVNFENMAGTYTEDPGSQGTGGLYQDVYPGQMVTNFNDWCFDESRQPGDHGIVETKYGYHIMYFVGDSETVYQDDNDLVAQKLYDAKLNELFSSVAPQALIEEAVFTEKAK